MEEFAFTGWTDSYGAGAADFWLVKTDANGQAEWNKTFGRAGKDVANSLVQTTDGGFALAGRTDSYGAGSFDSWLIKTSDSELTTTTTEEATTTTSTTKTDTTTTTAESTPPWTPLIVLMSLTALLFRKRMKRFN